MRTKIVGRLLGIVVYGTGAFEVGMEAMSNIWELP
jgi:hypothetical protein